VANDYFLSNFSGLHQLISDLNGQFQLMQGTQQDLKSRVNTALADRQGPAYQEFQMAAAAMDESISQLNVVLQQAIAAYEASLENGTTAEARGVASWGSLV
jgi:hypothetical protein